MSFREDYRSDPGAFWLLVGGPWLVIAAVVIGAISLAAQDGVSAGMRVNKIGLPIEGFAAREVPLGTVAMDVVVHQAAPVSELVVWLWHPVRGDDALELRQFYVARTPPLEGIHPLTPEWRYVGGLEAYGYNYRVFEGPR